MHMNAFVPRSKMSKRRRKELDAKKRRVWNVRPATRIVKSKKVYDRKKQPREIDPTDSGAVVIYAEQAGDVGMQTTVVIACDRMYAADKGALRCRRG